MEAYLWDRPFHYLNHVSVVISFEWYSAVLNGVGEQALPFRTRIIAKSDECSVAFDCFRFPDELLCKLSSVGHSSFDHIEFPGQTVSQLYRIGDRTSRHTLSQIIGATTKLSQENNRLKGLLADAIRRSKRKLTLMVGYLVKTWSMATSSLSRTGSKHCSSNVLLNFSQSPTKRLGQYVPVDSHAIFLETLSRIRTKPRRRYIPG